MHTHMRGVGAILGHINKIVGWNKPSQMLEVFGLLSSSSWSYNFCSDVQTFSTQMELFGQIKIKTSLSNMLVNFLEKFQTYASVHQGTINSICSFGAWSTSIFCHMSASYFVTCLLEDGT